MSLMLMIENQKMLESIKMLQDTIRQRDERIRRLEEAGDALKAAGYFGGFNDAVDKWIKVKEAKP